MSYNSSILHLRPPSADRWGAESPHFSSSFLFPSRSRRTLGEPRGYYPSGTGRETERERANRGGDVDVDVETAGSGKLRLNSKSPVSKSKSEMAGRSGAWGGKGPG